jgi:hypothetical protein
MSGIKNKGPLMNGLEYFLIVSLLTVLFQPFTFPSPLGGEGLGEETILGPNPAVGGTAEQRGIISNGVNIEERWGIQILSIRLSASDHMLDFRYRVIDPEKASSLLQKQTKPFLIHQETGEKLFVPRTKLGPLRQTAVKPIANRNYAILFGNKSKLVKMGDKVTVVIGDFKAENLTVE